MLPSPTCDPEVMSNMNDNKNRLHPKFLGGLEKLKFFLRGFLLPKRRFLDGELVTGEGNGESFFHLKYFCCAVKIHCDSMLKRFNF